MRKNGHKPTYASWQSMKSRCGNPCAGNYERYGAKGVTYDESWETFDNFLEDMGERPDGKTLDRIDSKKGYSKDNCRWATPSEQQSNRKNCMQITYNGITQTAAAWAKNLGLSKSTVWNRIKAGWNIEEAVTTTKAGTYHRYG